jgi:nicotinate-nucleotide pyrophosphorylase
MYWNCHPDPPVFVEATAGTKRDPWDTRKTRNCSQGCGLFNKLSVKRGCGLNHRIGLDDMVLIKDNTLIFRVADRSGAARPLCNIS